MTKILGGKRLKTNLESSEEQQKRFLWQASQNADYLEAEPPIVRDRVWVFAGGMAANGIRYASPSQAIAWGSTGCPLLPRVLRENYERIKLPNDLQELFTAPLTIDELDSFVFERCTNEVVWQPPPREFRDFLYSLLIPATQVAIPAGVPLAWIEALPITGRTRGSVQRAFWNAGASRILRVPMLAREFLNTHSVGLSILNELTCVIESAELERTSEEPALDLDLTVLQQEAAEHERLIGSDALLIVEGIRSFTRHICELAGWAMAETDAQTFGDAIAELQRAGSSNETWKPIALMNLTGLAMPPPHPYQVLDQWMEKIDPRWQVILKRRVSCYSENIVTLEELGAEFGVTRERVRQVEVKVRKALNRFLTSDDALPIRWRATTLRRTLGVAAPSHTVELLLTSPTGNNDHRSILLELAGPYDRDHDWLTLRSAKRNDPTSIIMTQVDDVGRIDKECAASQLTEWGLDVSFHERWLTRDGSVRLFSGQLVKWGTSIPDRLAFALADMGRPATVGELVAHVGENRSWNSINNALADDPRLVRVNRTHWALASWGLTEYSGIAESMRKLIEEFGGAMDVDIMVDRMHQMFGVMQNSTLVYCDAPMFVVEGKSLRLRTQDDGPYRYDSGLMTRTAGVFYLGPMRLGRLLKVDKNILRGSGGVLTYAAGSILGVEPKSYLSFGNNYGDKVDITFPESSFMGPSIGSVRRIAERLSAKEGDYLTLVLDRSDMSVSALLSDISGQPPGWDVISNLTGIEAPVDLSGLAKALLCNAGEVRKVLRDRGDYDVLNCLPKGESSAGLDGALAALQDHVEKVREGLA